MLKKLSIVYVAAILFVACAPITPAPASIQTPTLSPTLTASPHPIENTRTATASPSPTRAKTPTFVPTLTPATPLAKEASYRIQPASAAQADEIIASIASQLDATEAEDGAFGVYGDANHLRKYTYLAFAEQEALLRFKDAPQAEHWRWDLSYNLAMAYPFATDSDAPELKTYAQLMEDGLNSGATQWNNLPTWFAKHEPRIHVEVNAIKPPPNYEAGFVITLGHAAIFWAVQKDKKFSVYGLKSSLVYYREADGEYEFADINGDSIADLLILNFAQSNCCGFSSSSSVYDISQGIPQLLQFHDTDGVTDHVSGEGESSLVKLGVDEKRTGFVFKSNAGDPFINPCALKQHDKYEWDGGEFELTDTWYDIEHAGKYDKTEICDFAMNAAADKEEKEIVVKAIRETNELRTNQLSLEEFRAGINYRLGEYYAQTGNLDKAQKFFADVLAQPASPTTPISPQWSQAAKIFMENDLTGADYYKVCAKVDICDSSTALTALIHTLSPAQFLHLKDVLTNAGVSVRSSGFADFDDNQQMDQWFVVRIPRETTNQLWVVTQTSTGPQGLFVTKVAGTNPSIKNFNEWHLGPVTEIDSQTVFSLAWLKLAEKPYIEKRTPPSQKNEYEPSDGTKFLSQALDRIQTDLFLGDSPEEIQKQLLAIDKSPFLECQKIQCDQLYYLLGLSSELSGDTQNAVANYLRVWKEYPGSFFTIMARIKLAQ